MANELGTFVSGNAGTIFMLSLFVLILIILVIIGFIVYDILVFNKKIDAYKLVGTKYILYRTKGRFKKDKNGVIHLISKRFGHDFEKIDVKNPPKEDFTTFMDRLFGFPLFPYVVKEQICLLNVRGSEWISIKKSFVFLKRGIELNVTSKEECDFCRNAIDSYKFYNDDEYKQEKLNTLKDSDFDSVCTKCFSEIVNARFECIDPVDQSWLFQKLDDIYKKYGDFLTKIAPLIIIGMSFIFVLLLFIFTYKFYPDIMTSIKTSYLDAHKVVLEQQINAIKYNNTLPTN